MSKTLGSVYWYILEYLINGHFFREWDDFSLILPHGYFTAVA